MVGVPAAVLQLCQVGALPVVPTKTLAGGAGSGTGNLGAVVEVDAVGGVRCVTGAAISNTHSGAVPGAAGNGTSSGNAT